MLFRCHTDVLPHIAQLVRDARDRIAVGRAGNVQHGWISGVARNGYRVIVGGEDELGLHHGGRNHENRSHQAELNEVKCGFHGESEQQHII